MRYTETRRCRLHGTYEVTIWNPDVGCPKCNKDHVVRRRMREGGKRAKR